jgi:predicted peptidase
MHGVDRFAKEPCLFVAPQCLAIQVGGVKSTWISDDLNLLLAHLKKTLPMDEHRIYLTGNSMGGYGTWMWGAANPEHFAAIAPISGGIGQGGPKDVTPDLEKWAKNLATIPVFAFAGGKDRVVPADRSEKLVAAIQIAGGKKAKLKIYPDEGHNARTSVFASAEYFEWMFAQRRK